MQLQNLFALKRSFIQLREEFEAPSSDLHLRTFRTKRVFFLATKAFFYGFILVALESVVPVYIKTLAYGEVEPTRQGIYLSDTLLSEAALESLKLQNDPEMAHIFADESSSRPQKCPLLSNRPKALLDKMLAVAKGLRQGKCQNKGQELAEEIGSMVGKMSYSYRLQTSPTTLNQYTNNLQLAPNPNATNPALLYPDTASAAMAAQSANITKNLTQLLGDKDCAGELKTKGFLTAIADITTAMGQFAFYVPSPQSLLAGTGALAVGSSLKVLIKMFESPFDWSSTEDRQTFFTLNCSFYDLRRELEQAHFFEFNEESLAAKKKLLQSIQTRVETQIKKIEQVRVQIEANNLESLQGFMAQQIGIHRFRAIVSAKEILGVLTQNKVISEESKSYLLVDLADKASAFAKALQLSEFKHPYESNLVTLLKKLSIRSLTQLQKKEFTEVAREVIEPLKATIAKFLKDSEPTEAYAQARFMSLVNPSNNLTNQDLFDSQRKKVEEIQQDLIALSQKISLRLSLIEISSNRNSLEAGDDGAQMAFDILKEYQKIRDYIFGQRGWSFLHYLMTQIRKEMKHFERSYSHWRATYFMAPNQIVAQDLAWACRDAQQQRIHWDTANSGVELAYDFYNTNRGLLESHVPHYRKFLKFIPYAVSYQYNIYRNMVSGEQAYLILKGNPGYSPKDLHSILRHSHTNLGKLTLRVKLNTPKREELEKFLKTHNCGDAL